MVPGFGLVSGRFKLRLSGNDLELPTLQLHLPRTGSGEQARQVVIGRLFVQGKEKE